MFFLSIDYRIRFVNFTDLINLILFYLNISILVISLKLKNLILIIYFNLKNSILIILIHLYFNLNLKNF